MTQHTIKGRTLSDSRLSQHTGFVFALLAGSFLIGCEAFSPIPKQIITQHLETTVETDSPEEVAPASAPAHHGVVTGGVSSGAASASSVTSKKAEGAYAPLVHTTNQFSGERIRARFVVTEDGNRAWQGWHDLQRGEDCSFQYDAQGTLRCFPKASTNRIFFADASCSQAIAAANPDCGGANAAHYASVNEATACGSGIRVYTLGEAEELPALSYELDGSGACVPAAAGQSARVLGAALDPQTLVSAVYGSVGSTSRVESYGILAVDGAVEVTGFMDSQLNSPCAWSDSDHPQCLPLAQPIAKFSDPERSQGLIAVHSSACSVPAASTGAYYDLVSCSAEYFEAGESFVGDRIYSAEGPESLDAQGPDTVTYRQLGAPVEQATLPRAEKVSDPATNTRLQPFFLTTEDGGVWFNQWYDTLLDAPCSFESDAQGAMRCMPGDDSHPVIYGEPTCSDALIEMAVPERCQASDAVPQFIREHATEGCGVGIGSVRQVMQARSLTVVYDKQNDGSCLARRAMTDHLYFTLSAPLPLEGFVAGTSTIE